MFSFERFPASDLNINGSDLEVLRDEIVKRFSEAELGALLTFRCNVDWNNLIAANSFQNRVLALVEALRRAGQLHWLILLANRERQGSTRLEQLLSSVTPPAPADGSWPPETPQHVVVPPEPSPDPSPAPPAGTSPPQDVDPWHRVLLRDNRPFLDRKTFREDCKLVGLGGSRPILSVVGPQDTGKSYTARYLVDVAKQLDDNSSLVTKEIRLDRLNGVVEAGASSDIGGLRLARRLAEAITEEPLPEYIERSFGSEQDPTWAADAASWLSSNALSPPMRWVIFDGFQSTVLSPSAHSLVNSLLDEVARGGRIRIGLLGYLGNLGWCASAVREVHLDLDSFADEERLTGYVLSYLLEVSKEAEARGLPPFTADDVLAHTPQVLRQIDPSAPNLHDLESALTNIAERVLVGAR